MRFITIIFLIGIIPLFSGWGFYSHQRINRLAVFALPPDMVGFYKHNITYITEAAINPDKRRFTVVDEAPRHYLDIDHYGDSAFFKVPRNWKDAVIKYTEDTLKAYGIIPWHINVMYYRLKDAMAVRDPERILKLSADLGHYIADAHVPLHTTENYNGQLTGQEGIHAFWESRLPELFSDQYNFFVGKAQYISNPQQAAWNAIEQSHAAVDSVLLIEKRLSVVFADRKYSFETKGRQTVKVFSQEYSNAYHKALRNMVEQRMKAAIRMTADFWYTAWIDAGQPELNSLSHTKPTDEELARRREDLAEMKRLNVRSHEE